MDGEHRWAVGLVRHAATAWTGRRYCGRSDPPLSAAGRHAADRLAAALAARPWTRSQDPGADPAESPLRIVTSPLARAVQTGQIIAAAMGARAQALEMDDRWREADFGIAEGRTFDALAATEPELARRLLAGDVAIDWPGGETAAALEMRVCEALMAILATDRPTIVVSHGGPLRIAIAHATGRAAVAVSVPSPGALTWIVPAPAVGEPAGHPTERPPDGPPRATLRP